MLEKDLIELGFEKEISQDLINGEPEFYYYVKEITNGLTFITNANNEIGDDGWYVEFFNTEIPVRYYEHCTVKTLIELIEGGIARVEEGEPYITFKQNKDE